MNFIPIVMPMMVPMPGGGGTGIDLTGHGVELPTPEGYHWKIKLDPFPIVPGHPIRLWLYRGTENVSFWECRANKKSIQRKARRVIRRHIRLLEKLA